MRYRIGSIRNKWLRRAVLAVSFLPAAAVLCVIAAAEEMVDFGDAVARCWRE